MQLFWRQDVVVCNRAFSIFPWQRSFLLMSEELDSQTIEQPDPLAGKFLQYLASKGGSVYTERNYRQALREFSAWSKARNGGGPNWPNRTRDDFS